MYTYKYIHTHAYTYMHIYLNIYKHICVYMFLFRFFPPFFPLLFSSVSFFLTNRQSDPGTGSLNPPYSRTLYLRLINFNCFYFWKQ